VDAYQYDAAVLGYFEVVSVDLRVKEGENAP